MLGKKDVSKLMPKKVVDKRGRVVTVYVKTDNWEREGFKDHKEIKEWIDNNVTDPVEAMFWKRYNFKPEEAKQWRAAKFTPWEAAGWRDNDFNIEEAKKWKNVAGVFDGEKAKEWKKYNFTPEKAAKYVKINVKPADAAKYEKEKIPYEKVKEIRHKEAEAARREYEGGIKKEKRYWGD